MVVKYVKEFKFPSDKGFTGSAGKMSMRHGGAMVAAPKASSKAPTRAQFDTMMTKRKSAMTPMITPVQRRAMNNETMMGSKPGDYAKGGAAKKSSMVKNPKKAMGVALRAIALSEAFDAGMKSKTPVKKAMGGMMHGGMMHDGYAKGGKSRR